MTVLRILLLAINSTMLISCMNPMYLRLDETNRKRIEKIAIVHVDNAKKVEIQPEYYWGPVSNDMVLVGNSSFVYIPNSSGGIVQGEISKESKDFVKRLITTLQPVEMSTKHSLELSKAIQKLKWIKVVEDSVSFQTKEEADQYISRSKFKSILMTHANYVFSTNMQYFRIELDMELLTRNGQEHKTVSKGQFRQGYSLLQNEIVGIEPGKIWLSNDSNYYKDKVEHVYRIIGREMARFLDD